ncbi:MAG TPA: class I SAM-dependent methyltransferase [Mycobacteriales bacterium]|jgi:SAM-dependent methyltransferase|nr:class I SAM-dependent methyltransferase [Mycobacteriales bacterium]
MHSSVIGCYESGLHSVAAGEEHGWSIRSQDGVVREFPLQSWCGGLIPGDETLLECCTGPTLDVGCGPGRLTEALAQRGVPVLGVDIAPEAIRRTRARGVAALRRDVFGPIPGEGRWQHVILADGNVGIGGEPRRLLERAGELLAPGGSVLCEIERPGTSLRRLQLRLERADQHSAWFPWALLGADELSRTAPEIGFQLCRMWTEAGRWFSQLVAV